MFYLNRYVVTIYLHYSKVLLKGPVSIVYTLIFFSRNRFQMQPPTPFQDPK